MRMARSGYLFDGWNLVDEATSTTTTVPSVMLDTVVEALHPGVLLGTARVVYVKLDVGGHEAQALEGLQGLLGDYPPLSI